MNYQLFRKQERNFLSLTCLKIAEFDYLLGHFEPLWENYYRHHTLEGKKRKNPAIKEHGSAKLRGTDIKLFFLLVYLKSNALQTYQAASFGVSQTKVSRITNILLNVLNKTLSKMGLTPCRQGSELQHILADHYNKVFSYDGTERNIERNKDQEAQKKDFSGKKGQHKVKNNLLCDDIQYIHYLSPTVVGSTHDITIAREYPMILPQNSILRVDLGFQSLQVEGCKIIEIPFKKTPKKELSFSKKIFNKMLSSTRVVVEHTNSGVKRLRMVKDTIRFHALEKRDFIMQIACALHNLRVKSPFRAYKKSKTT